MTRWLSDTLSRRLLLLMWAALVGSHLIAFATVRLVHFPSPGPGSPGVLQGLPTLPSLPPTFGAADPGRERAGEAWRAGPTAINELRADGGPAEEGPPPGEPPGEASPLPLSALLLDYGVRFVVIAAAAWMGSRWLSAPMQRLVSASSSLGESIAADATLPELDERGGTVEIREAARVFNKMAAQLREQFHARGLMVAAISHDLRTPLTRLRIRLETMGDKPELQQRSIRDIEEMNDLIDNVLEVFRPQEGAREMPQRTPNALRRVVGNLAANALRYGKEAVVSVTSDERCVRIVVEDIGPGIAPAELEAVFRPFYRVEGSRNRHSGGVGLGLFIARDLVERQHGKLELSNRPSGGLRAEVLLPRR